MRRPLALLASTLVALFAVSAIASAAPTRSHDTTAEAFWHFKQQLTSTSYTLTTWYVGVFAGTDGGTFRYSDLYQDVEHCTTASSGRTHCTEVSSKYGDTDLSRPTDSFTMDFRDLTEAHLVGTYRLQSYDQNGDPVGTKQTYHIASDWAGYGDVTKNHQKFSFHQGCIHFAATIKGKMRPARATGLGSSQLR